MTIAELILELQNYDPTALIAVYPTNDDDGTRVELVAVLQEIKLSCSQPWTNKDYFRLARKREQESGDTVTAIVLF